MVSWPTQMTTWIVPRMMSGITTSASQINAVTSATPLNIVKFQGYGELIAQFGSKLNLYKALFLGTVGGSLGETSALLLLIGGIYLIVRKVIDWKVPIFYILSVFVLSTLFGRDPVFSILAGGLFLGAFFMATDMVTIPITIKGQIIFAVGAGALTVLIRLQGGFPEGVCYAILLMNCVTPLIDRVVKPVKYGARR